MKYTGRWIALGIIVVRCVGWALYEHSAYGEFVNIYFLIFVFELLVAWWLGYQYDKAKFYSQKDALTAVYNRRFIYDIFPKLAARADRTHQRIGVFLMDVDDFKYVNDKHGHRVGDAVIQQISNVLVANTRKCDFVCRWGGDEFVLIVPDTDLEPCSVILQRIEHAMRGEAFTRYLSSPLSLSVGVAMYPDDGQSFDDLVRIADTQMYEHKHAKLLAPIGN